MVSILIPTYNSESRLCYCLNSILQQSYTDYEVIICDGGSSDNTISIILQFAKKSYKFKYYFLKKHSVSIQRNFLLRKAKGKYVIFIDSDDEIENDCLSRLVFDIKNGYDVVSPNIIPLSEDGDAYGLIKIHSPSIEISCNNFFDYQKRYLLNPPVKLYKRKFIKGIYFDENLSFGEDAIFNYCISKKAKFKYFLDVNAKYYYFKKNNENNITKYKKYLYAYMLALYKIYEQQNILSTKLHLFSYIYQYNLDYLSSRRYFIFFYFKFRFIMIKNLKFLKFKQIVFLIMPLIYLFLKKIKNLSNFNK